MDEKKEYTLPHDHGRGSAEALRRSLSEIGEFRAASGLFSLLADESRVKIFWLLCHSEECVTNIASLTDMTGPAVSHHLQKLRAAGLLECRRDGKETYYRAADTELAGLLHVTAESVMRLACPVNSGQGSAEETVRAVHDYMSENLDRMITIDELALKFNINTTTLKQTFKKVYGTSVAAHMRMHRMEKAAQLLRETDKSINDIALSVGYKSMSRFALVFKEEYGTAPTDYRKKPERNE